MPVIVLATGNQGKIKELTALLQGWDTEFKVLGLKDFPEIGPIPETGSTFLENATQKACEVSRKTGLVAVADDSGLEVDALNGAPGVYSARYSGENATDASNNDKLLKEMESVPEKERTARFKCVVVACTPDNKTLDASGTWEGFVARDLKGSHGFGYDPLFIDSDSGRRAAELTSEEKNTRSHRAKALKNLLQSWPSFWKKVKSAS